MFAYSLDIGWHLAIQAWAWTLKDILFLNSFYNYLLSSLCYVLYYMLEIQRWIWNLTLSVLEGMIMV